MAYTRWNESGNYIYGGTDHVSFNGINIDDDEIDVFIYKLYERQRSGGDEFWERYEHGVRVIINFQKGIRVRKYTKHAPDDLKTIVAAIDVLAEEILQKIDTPVIYGDTTKSCCTYYAAFPTGYENTDKPIGYCGVVDTEDCLLLNTIGVRHGFRGKGVARSLLAEAKALCRWEYGYEKIRVAVNRQNSVAIAAFQKMGFMAVDDYTMELVVPSASEGG